MSERGEVTTQVSVNGRNLTLDPIQEIDLHVPWREVESNTPCGMRQEFVSCEDEDGQKFVLASGAGCGNPYLTATYKGRNFCVDVRDIAQALINFVNEGK